MESNSVCNHTSDKQNRTTVKQESDLLIASMITDLIIYMKKLLDSDWLRAVQFKCNTSAKSVAPVQITHRNSGL